MLKYDKLFKLLSQNGYTASKVKETGLMGQSTYYGIQKGNSNLDGKTINKICSLFKCQPNDIIEYYPDDIIDNNDDISKKLFDLRNKNSFPESFVADKLNIEHKDYVQYESGIRPAPLDILLKACKLYNVPQSYFGINSDLVAVGNKGYTIQNTETCETLEVTAIEFEMLKKIIEAFRGK